MYLSLFRHDQQALALGLDQLVVVPEVLLAGIAPAVDRDQPGFASAVRHAEDNISDQAHLTIDLLLVHDRQGLDLSIAIACDVGDLVADLVDEGTLVRGQLAVSEEMLRDDRSRAFVAAGYGQGRGFLCGTVEDRLGIGAHRAVIVRKQRQTGIIAVVVAQRVQNEGVTLPGSEFLQPRAQFVHLLSDGMPLVQRHISESILRPV